MLEIGKILDTHDCVNKNHDKKQQTNRSKWGQRNEERIKDHPQIFRPINQFQHTT